MITEFDHGVDLNPIKHIFPQAPLEVWDRPQGPVDILLGLDNRHLQPAGGLERDGCAVGGLRLSESRFGCGWVVSGTHPSIRKSEHKITPAAKTMMTSISLDTDLSVHDDVPVVKTHFTKFLSTPEFFQAEDLGVAPLRSCNNCQKCPDCNFRNECITRTEAIVVEKQDKRI